MLLYNNVCDVSYAVKSVRVDDISELSLVPSISVYSTCYSMYSGEYDVCVVTLSVHHHILEYTDNLISKTKELDSVPKFRQLEPT